MENKLSAPGTIDEYIGNFPEDVQVKLQAIRSVIKSVVPEAKEGISYQMPGFMYNGPLVYFAAFQNHIGFYPTPGGIDEFKEELSKYKQGKGSVQFPIKEEIPLDLIARMTAYRVKENRQKKTKNQKEKKMSKLNLGLGHIGIIVKDLEVSKKFYCDNLDFTVTHENTLTENGEVIKISFVEANGCTLELIQVPQYSKRVNGPVDHIAFKVVDIESAWKQLKAKGILFETESVTTASGFFEKGDRWILFSGPDGERLEINEIL